MPKNLFPILFPEKAYAQSIIECPDGTKADPEIGCVFSPENVVHSQASIAEIILKAASGLMSIAIVFAIIFIIYGGIQYAIASGEEDRIQKAKCTIVWSVIGLAVAILGRVIAKSVLGIIS